MNPTDTLKSFFNKKDYEKVIEIATTEELSDPELLYMLGISFYKTGKFTTAKAFLKRCVKISNSNEEYLRTYASILRETGEYSNALKILNTLMGKNPNNISIINEVVSILGTMGKITIALKLSEFAVKQTPNNHELYNNIGNLQTALGNSLDASESYRKSLSICPNYFTAHANLMLAMNYYGAPQKEIFKASQKCSKMISFSSTRTVGKRNNGKIRIGYVSSDFRIHSVSYFFEGIIKNHNCKEFEVYCYHDISVEDSQTRKIKKYATKWRNTYHIRDEEFYHLVNSDQIDILVDLNGYSGKNRLSVFSAKAAPIQVTYLGYPNTTGLLEMDYRFTSNSCEPPLNTSLYTEKLYMIPNTFLSYTVPQEILNEKIKIACSRNEYVTYGIFNNMAKITPEFINAVIEILKKTKFSKLVIKNKSLNDESLKKNMEELFLREGISLERIEIKSYSYSFSDHIKEYKNIDIALDTFPYNGTTTTFEAAAMGVPTITIHGEWHASCVGKMINENISLSDFTTDNFLDYITQAVTWSDKIPKLIEIKSRLRENLLASPLCNSAELTLELEKAYRIFLNDYK